MKKFFYSLKNNIYMLKLVFEITPFYVIGSLINALLGSLTAIIGDVWLTQYVIDSVQYKREFTDVLQFIGFITIIFLINGIFGSLFVSIYVPIAQQKLSQKMQHKLSKKAIDSDLQYYDDPQYYELFILSSSNADTRSIEVLNSFIGLISAIFTISGVVYTIIYVDPVCLLFVFASVILSLFINTKKSKMTYEQDIKMKEINLKRNYYHRVFYLNDYAKELRTSKVKEILLKKYKEETDKLSQVITQYSKRNFFYSFANGFLINTFLIDVLYFFTLILRAALFKTISFGSIASMVNAAWTLNNSFNIIKNVIPQIILHSLYIEKFKEFFSLKSKFASSDSRVGVPEKLSKINITNGTFSYPEDKTATLKNINISINNNEKIAIVGRNGSGKTTLLKLLMRFYDFDQGALKINGTNIKEYDAKEYRLKIGTIFQDFKLFATKISENVWMDTVDVKARKHVCDIVEKVFPNNEFIKEKIDAYYTSEFSDKGIYLSGGQEQMIALARAFAREKLFIVLDEPSSSLDPMTEERFNETFRELSINNTVIFISHRMSITKYVDKIYVMSNGSIIESGTHDELMNLKGEYFKMFTIQAEKYKV